MAAGQRTLTAFFKRPVPTARDGSLSPSKKRPATTLAVAAAATPDDAPAPLPLDRAAAAAAAAAATAAAEAAVAAARAEARAPRLPDLLVAPDWRPAVAPALTPGLQAFLEREWASARVFPPPPLIFRALNEVPLPTVRVVIIGQDPYHGPGQAEGLAFSVPRGVAVPSSLRNIHKELADDVGAGRPCHGSLAKWVRQGVLLLNATLTVRSGAANSHAGKGWDAVTDAAVAAVARRPEPAVFLLWGKFAERKAARVDRGKHVVLTAPHPSGLSAHRGFFGCRHFSAANAALAERGLDPIDWDLSTP